MTREEKINTLKAIIQECEEYQWWRKDALFEIIKDLEQEPCDDAISRQAVLNIYNEWFSSCNIADKKESPKAQINALPPVTPQQKIGHCRDCKWWKDSDGMFKRGIEAESKCPINRIEVYEGDGYCFMFEPMESETKK